MAKSGQALLVSWLNDAYAMEESQIKMLERFIKDFEDMGDVKRQLQGHLQETQRQKDDLTACLESLGEKPSTAKSAMSKLMGAVEGMSTSIYQDTKLKDMIMIHAGEHFEHACYLSLIRAAEHLGEHEIADICREIADQERSTAEWAEQEIERLTDLTLQSSPAPVHAGP